ncbi:MAG: hypothetical protein IJS45_05465 [Clostridia bacterium]|nr:hypothetical protein [Clostridia bacterium]
MKKIIALAVVFMMVFALASCGNSALKNAAGKYEGVQSKFVGDDEWETGGFSLELKADGTAVSTRDGTDYSATWEIEGENFKMTEKFLGLTIEYTGTLKDGDLHIYNGDPADALTYEYVYKKN